MEQLSELAVEDAAAAGPAHPPRLVHTAVDQEAGYCSGQRGGDPKTGTMALGIVDQPSVLAGQIERSSSRKADQSRRDGVIYPGTKAAPAGTE
jgi:hypothetical protein